MLQANAFLDSELHFGYVASQLRHGRLRQPTDLLDLETKEMAMPSLLQTLDAGKSWPGLETEEARKLQQPRFSQGEPHISLSEPCVLLILS